MYGTTLQPGIGKYPLVYASALLGGVAVLVTIPIYIFYFKGAWFRERSKFASSLNESKGEMSGRRKSSVKGY